MRYAFKDLGGALSNLSLLSMISAKRLEVRYRRNVLGVGWIAIGFGVPSLGIAWVMSLLQGLPLDEHVPHVMFGFAGWYFMIDCLVSGCNTLTSSRSMLLQAPMERSVFILSMLVDKLIVLSVSLVTAILICVPFGWQPDLALAYVPVALGIYVLAGLGSVMLLSILATRIRDMFEVMSSIMRVLFFFTPIIWAANTRSMPADSPLSVVAKYNPFTYFLDVLRGPLMGEVPGMLTWVVTVPTTALLLLLGLVALQRGGRNIAFFV